MPSSRNIFRHGRLLVIKYGLVLEGTICPWISKRQTQKRKNINALSLNSYIHQGSKPSLRTDLWAERREWEPLKRSSLISTWPPQARGLPPTLQKGGWSLQPVTLPHLMPKDFRIWNNTDPAEAKAHNWPRKPTGKCSLCPGRAQPNLEAQTWNILWSQGLFIL